MCDGEHAAQEAVVVVVLVVVDGSGCLPFAGRPSLDDECERTEADRRAEHLLLVRVCAHVPRAHVLCHLYIGGRGSTWSPGRQVPCRVPCHARGCPRRILIRSEKREGPFPAWAPFLGYVLALPPVGGAPTKEPFSSPPAQFLSRRGHWSVGYINAAVLHSQSSTDLTISAPPGPPDACCTVQTVVNQIAQVPECPPELRIRGLTRHCCAGLAV